MRRPWCIPLWPHLPLPLLFLGTGAWIGYRAPDHDDFGFEFSALAPLAIILALGLVLLSAAMVTLATPVGKKRFAAAQILVLSLTAWLYPRTVSWGHWEWEQRILKSRIDSLRRFSPPPNYQAHHPVSIEGHTFAAFEETPEGKVFYTLELGGPFPSTGVFVPFADDYRGFEPPQEVRPSIAGLVAPSSVPGVFWLVTKD